MSCLRMVIKNTTPCHARFLDIRQSGLTTDSREMKKNSCPRVSNEVDTLFWFLLAGLSYRRTLSRLEENNKGHRRLPLVDTIMSTRLASDLTYSGWPINGLQKHGSMAFSIVRLNPYAITPSQVLRTIHTSHELQLFYRCVPLLVDEVTLVGVY